MANPEHIARLSEGVERWNRWQKQRFLGGDDSRANLREADLRNFRNLSLANLGRVDLTKADLTRVDLSGANLSEATLISATLAMTQLRGTDLTGSDLTQADLHNADVRYSILEGAILNGADVSFADFTGATAALTSFAGLDLRTAAGLEHMAHVGPSSIGIDTIYRSRGKIPKEFLRGAGVPDNFIRYVQSVAGGEFEFYSCFISYSVKDRNFAERLHADLQESGVRCWFAKEDLKTGEKIRSRIYESIGDFDKLLLVLSQDSIVSPWVEYEVEAAFERERREDRRVLFPIRVDDVVMETDVAWAAHLRHTRQIGDFCGWKDADVRRKAFERLLRDLRLDAVPAVSRV